VVETDRNGEFRPQAQRLAGFAFGEENTPAQVFTGHVEERIGRLQHGNLDSMRVALGEEIDDVG
jgi:hypothetical protein